MHASYLPFAYANSVILMGIHVLSDIHPPQPVGSLMLLPNFLESTIVSVEDNDVDARATLALFGALHVSIQKWVCFAFSHIEGKQI